MDVINVTKELHDEITASNSLSIEGEITTQEEVTKPAKKRTWPLVLAGLMLFIAGFVSSWFATPYLAILYHSVAHRGEQVGHFGYDEWGNVITEDPWEDQWDSLTTIVMPDGSSTGVPGIELQITDEMMARYKPLAEKVKTLLFPGFVDMEPFDVRAFENEGITEVMFLHGDDNRAFEIVFRSDGSIGYGSSNISIDWSKQIETIEELEAAWNNR